MVDVTCWHPPSSLLPTPSLPSPLSLSLSWYFLCCKKNVSCKIVTNRMVYAKFDKDSAEVTGGWSSFRKGGGEECWAGHLADRCLNVFSHIRRYPEPRHHGNSTQKHTQPKTSLMPGWLHQHKHPTFPNCRHYS